MQAFEYTSPKTVQEAVRLLGSDWGEAALLAGGTDLISAMKDEIESPKRVVSLKEVKGLSGIEFNSHSGLRVGALTTIRELLDNANVQQHYPGLLDAADGIRGEQMRHMGTVSGELLQRPRCWYYRNGYGLLATYQGKPLVPDGENQYHAILGNSGPAYFVSPSSLAPILIALGARAALHGPLGDREVEVAKLFVTPTREGEREHDIRANEILTEIRVPAHRMAQMAGYEVRQKQALDWPLATAAVVLHLEGGKVLGARVVLGHVAPVPWPSPEAEEALQGKEISESVAEAAGKAAVSKATPLSRNAYKQTLARVAVKRAILNAAKRGT
jgi:xanthine dehydrogenase YagS FAD-binding subunit